VGPFRIIDAGIRRWLWAHSGLLTLLLRWAHSGFSTLLLGGDCGPNQECQYLCFGGPIQDYRRRYSAVAMGPFRTIGRILLHLWSAHSTMLPAYIHGPIRIYRRHRFALEVGPFETISNTSVLALNPFGPIRRFRHTNSTSLKVFLDGPTRDHPH
jgi:hypothetical protein